MISSCSNHRRCSASPSASLMIYSLWAHLLGESSHDRDSVSSTSITTRGPRRPWNRPAHRWMRATKAGSIRNVDSFSKIARSTRPRLAGTRINETIWEENQCPFRLGTTITILPTRKHTTSLRLQTTGLAQSDLAATICSERVAPKPITCHRGLFGASGGPHRRQYVNADSVLGHGTS